MADLTTEVRDETKLDNPSMVEEAYNDLEQVSNEVQQSDDAVTKEELDKAAGLTSDVYTTSMDDLERKVAEEEKEELESQPLGPAENTATMDYAKAIIEARAKPPKASDLPNKEELWDRYGEEYIDKHRGDEAAAQEEFDEVYKTMSKQYNVQADEETTNQILDTLSFAVFDMDDQFEFVDPGDMLQGELVMQTDSGRAQVLNTWTDATRSTREAAVESKKVVDDEGNEIKFTDDPFDELVDNEKYTNKEGKKIVAFEYQLGDEYSRGAAKLKAIYEGDEPKGEVVSRWDTGKYKWISKNGLDTSAWKVAAGSIVDIVVDIADTAMSGAEHAANIMSFGTFSDTELYKDLRDVRLKLASAKTSTSDYDQQHMVSWNNFVGLGMNVALQLGYGRGIAYGMSKLLGVGVKSAMKLNSVRKEWMDVQKAITATKDAAKLTDLTKKASNLAGKFVKMQKTFGRKSNIVKASSLLAMGAMQAKETGDEALKAGFTPGESALIYAASLGLQSWANQLSDLGFESLGLQETNAIIKQAVKNGMRGITPKTANAMTKVINNVGKQGGWVRQQLARMLGSQSKGVGAHTLTEAMEEELEFLADEVVRHAATAMSTLGYDKDSAPKFQTVMDEGYFDRFFVESAMNMFGGAMGGFMMGTGTALFSKQHVNEAKLPYKGDTEDVMRHIAYYSTRTGQGAQWEEQFLGYAKHLYDKGALGRKDLSTKWNAEESRYYRTNELSDEDKQKYQSQADVQYKSLIGQYIYFKNQYQNQEGTVDELKKANENFASIFNSSVLYEDTKKLMKEKNAIEVSAKAGDIDMNEQLAKLGEMEDDVDDEGNMKKKDKYDDMIGKLADATGLKKKQLTRLIEIEKQLKSIADGTMLEEAFLKTHLKDPDFDKLDYKKLLSIVKSDNANFMKLHESYTKNKETEKANSKIILSDIKSGAPLSVLLQRIKPGMLIDGETRKQLLAYVQNHPDIAVKFNDAKKKIQNGIIDDIEALVKESPEIIQEVEVDAENNIIGNTMPLTFNGKTLVAALREAVDKGENVYNVLANPDSLNNPGAIVSMLSQIEETKDQVKFAALIKPMFKLKYMIDTIDDVSKLKTIGSLGTIKYEPSQIKYAYLEDFVNLDNMSFYDVFMEKTESPPLKTSNAATVLDKFIDNKEELEKLQNITSIVSNTKSVREEDYKVFEPFQYTVEKNSDDTYSTGTTTLADKYNTLVAQSTRDSNGKIKFFADKQAAEDLKWQATVRKQEIMFMMKEMKNINAIYEANAAMGIETTPKTEFTQYVSKYFVNLDSFRLAPDNMTEMFEKQLKAVDEVYKRADELSKMADNANVDLLKVFNEDAADHATHRIESLSSFLTKALTPGNPIYTLENKKPVEDALAILNTVDLTRKARQLTPDDIVERFNLVHKAVKTLKPHLTDPKFKKAMTEFIRMSVQGFSEEEAASSSTTTLIDSRQAKTLGIMLVSPVDTVMKRVKATLKEAQSASDAELMTMKVPTVSQILMAEEVVAAMDPHFFEFVPLANPNHYHSLAVFQGRQGTGKTTVVAGLAAEIVQELNPGSSVVLAANNEDQIEGLKANTPKTVRVKGTMTQNGLWNAIANTDRTALEIAESPEWSSVNMIIYDEISYMEYSAADNDIEASKKINKQNVDKIPVLNAILAKLDKINYHRHKKGLPPIRLIGLGDSNQGGFMDGMVSPRNTSGKAKLGEELNVFAHQGRGTIHISNNELKHNFRANVIELTNAANSLVDKIDAGIGKFPSEEWQRIKFIHHYDPKDGFTGAQMSTSWTEDVINNERLVEDIRKKIEATKDKPKDQKFSVVVISGEKKYDGTAVPKTSKLGKLIEEFPDHFRLRGFEQVQGSEADYSLVNVTPDFLPFHDSVIKNKQHTKRTIEERDLFDNRMRQLSMALGRARSYGIVTMSKPLDAVLDKEGPTTIIKPADMLEFKKGWLKTLNDGILANYGEAAKLEELPDNDTSFEEVELPGEGETTYTPPPLEVGMVLVDEGSKQYYVVVSVADNGSAMVKKANKEGVVESGTVEEPLDIDDYNDGIIITKKEFDNRRKKNSKKAPVMITYKALNLKTTLGPEVVGDTTAIAAGNEVTTIQEFYSDYKGAIGFILDRLKKLNIKVDTPADYNSSTLTDILAVIDSALRTTNDADIKLELRRLRSMTSGLADAVVGNDTGVAIEKNTNKTRSMSDNEAIEMAKEAERSGELLSYTIKKDQSHHDSIKGMLRDMGYIFDDIASETQMLTFFDEVLRNNESKEKFVKSLKGYKIKLVTAGFTPKGGTRQVATTLVAVDKEGNTYPMARFSYAESYKPGVDEPPGSKRGAFYKFLLEQRAKIDEAFKNKEETSLAKKQVKSNDYYTEVEVPEGAIPYFFQGITVGSPATDGYSAIEEIAKYDESVLSKEPGRFIENRVKRRYDLNAIVNDTGISELADENDLFFDFKTNKDKSSKFFVEYKSKSGSTYYITAVDTQRGFIPFAKSVKTGKWQVIVGMTKEGIPILADPKSIGPETSYIASSILSKLKWPRKTSVKNKNEIKRAQYKVTSAAVRLSNTINSMLRLDNTTRYSSENKDRILLTNKLKQYKGNYMGDVALPVDQAISVWHSQASGLSVSPPFVIRRGVNAGMAMVMYTFNKDLRLEGMSEEELQDIYDNMAQSINSSKSVTSIDNNGVGIVLLDPTAMNFTQLYDLIINENKTISDDDSKFDEVIISKEAEKKLIGMFGVMADILIEKTDPINKIAKRMIEFAELTDADRNYVEAKLKTMSNDEQNSLTLLLSQLLKKEKLGKIVIGHQNAEFVDLVQEFQTRVAAMDPNEGNRAVVEQEVFEELKKDAHYGDVIVKNGIKSPDAIKLVANDSGKAPKGQVLLSQSTHKALMVQAGPFAVADPDSFAQLFGATFKDVIPDPKFNIIALLSDIRILSTMGGSKLKEGLLTMLDTVLEGFPALPKGIFVPPKTTKSSRSISMAYNIGEDMKLTTTVKQIRPPAPVINTSSFEEGADVLKPVTNEGDEPGKRKEDEEEGKKKAKEEHLREMKEIDNAIKTANTRAKVNTIENKIINYNSGNSAYSISETQKKKWLATLEDRKVFFKRIIAGTNIVDSNNYFPDEVFDPEVKDVINSMVAGMSKILYPDTQDQLIDIIANDIKDGTAFTKDSIKKRLKNYLEEARKYHEMIGIKNKSVNVEQDTLNALRAYSDYLLTKNMAKPDITPKSLNVDGSYTNFMVGVDANLGTTFSVIMNYTDRAIVAMSEDDRYAAAQAAINNDKSISENLEASIITFLAQDPSEFNLKGYNEVITELLNMVATNDFHARKSILKHAIETINADINAKAEAGTITEAEKDAAYIQLNQFAMNNLITVTIDKVEGVTPTPESDIALNTTEDVKNFMTDVLARKQVSDSTAKDVLNKFMELINGLDDATLTKIAQEIQKAKVSGNTESLMSLLTVELTNANTAMSLLDPLVFIMESADAVTSILDEVRDKTITCSL